MNKKLAMGSDFGHDKIVEFDNQKFTDKKEYLEHWKTNYHHQIIPIKEINNTLQRTMSLEKDHNIGL